MGSTRVLQVAMGRTEADEYKANLSQLTERVRGNVGLFFTKLPRHEARQGHVHIPLLLPAAAAWQLTHNPPLPGCCLEWQAYD